MNIRDFAIIAAAALFSPAPAPALTLQEGLAIVTEKGRDVALAKADQEVAEGALSLARSPYLPSVDLYGSETWLRYEPQALTPAGSFPLSQDRFPTYGFKVTQLVYDFGRTTSSISASLYNVRAKDADAVRARNRAALDFIISYMDLLETEKLLQVATDEVKLHEAHLKDTEARYGAGVITRNEVLQAKVTLADARQRTLTAENLRSMRASRLNSLLLRPLTETVQAEEVSATPSAGITLEAALQTAEAGSPDLKDIDARIQARKEANSAIRSEYAPTVFVSGGYEYQENRFMVRNDNWTLIAGINMNLFSGGATRAKLHVGEGELKSLAVTKDKVLDGVRLDVQRNYLDLQSSLRKVDVTRESVAQAEENLRLQRLRYQEGVGTATEVLDAVTLLTTAETNAWKALYDSKRAEAGLLYSMGRDLMGEYGK